MNDKYNMTGHKLLWHLDRLQSWCNGDRIAPINVQLGITNGCNINCVYCVSGDTKILMHDFTWKDICNVVVGDSVIGFDEKTLGDRTNSKYYVTTVLETFKRKAETITIVSDKVSLRITDEHPMLCSGHRWRKPKVFDEAKIRFFCSPYNSTPTSDSFKLGYLKGLLEGDGTFGVYKDKREGRNGFEFYKFKIEMADTEALDRCKQYVFDLLGFMLKSTRSNILRIDSRDEVNLLCGSIYWKHIIDFGEYDLDFSRGYLGGIFDADGSNNEGLLRISQYDTNVAVINHIKQALSIVGISYTKEEKGFYLAGTYEDRFKFFASCKPAITRKYSGMYNKTIPSTVSVVKQDGIFEDVYNIRTGSSTYVANGFCVHNCYGNEMGKVGVSERVDMPLETIERFFKDCVDLDVRSISLVGEGENTLHPNFYEIIKSAKDNCLDMGMATNGLLLKEDYIREVLKSFVWIRFSIGAAERDVYKSVHGANGFYRLIGVIKKCVEEKRNLRLDTTLGLQMVVINDNMDQIVPLAKLGKELGVDYFVAKPCSDTPDGKLEVPHEKYLTLEKVFKSAESYATKDYAVVMKRGKFENLGKSGTKTCRATQFVIQIDAKGNVAPCGHLLGYRKDEFNMGNIVEQSFKDIVNSERYAMVQNLVTKMDVNEECETNCLHYYMNQFLEGLMHVPEHVNFV